MVACPCVKSRMNSGSGAGVGGVHSSRQFQVSLDVMSNHMADPNAQHLQEVKALVDPVVLISRLIFFNWLCLPVEGGPLTPLVPRGRRHGRWSLAPSGAHLLVVIGSRARLLHGLPAHRYTHDDETGIR